MTEANKPPHAKSKSPLEKKTGRGKLILLLIGIIILAAYLIKDVEFTWIHPEYPINETSSIQQITKKQSSIKPEEPNGCLMPDTLPTTSDDEIVKFAPKEVAGEEIEKFPADDSSQLNPYETPETQSQEAEVASENLANNLNDYRVFLANVNEMTLKFSRDVDYSDNLAIIMQLDFPPKIKEIVVMLEAYNKMIDENKMNSEQVLLFNTNIFEKFLKINKDTSSHSEMKELKAKIEEKIDLLNDYIFSSDLQEVFLK